MTECKMMECNNQKQLKRFIDEVSFAIDDLVLFLDTHPCNKEALECYEEYKEMRHEALIQYTQQYGPMLKDHVDVADCWTWALQPWPWKGEC